MAVKIAVCGTYSYIRYRRALKDFGHSKDIVVWTPDEIAEWQNVPNAFVTTALREGIVLYEE